MEAGGFPAKGEYVWGSSCTSRQATAIRGSSTEHTVPVMPSQSKDQWTGPTDNRRDRISHSIHPTMHRCTHIRRHVYRLTYTIITSDKSYSPVSILSVNQFLISLWVIYYFLYNSIKIPIQFNSTNLIQHILTVDLLYAKHVCEVFHILFPVEVNDSLISQK